jgi:hypothetical protein
MGTWPIEESPDQSNLYNTTSKVPVLRYEIKNVDVDHNFLQTYLLITILDYR